MTIADRILWIGALIDARHELHYTLDRWEIWNDVEDFFGAWLAEVNER